MFFEKNFNPRSIAKIVVLSGAILLIVLNFKSVAAMFQNIYSVIFPLLLGAGIAYVLNLLVSGYERIIFPRSKKRIIIMLRSTTSILLSIITILLVLLIFLLILMPQLGTSIRLLIDGLPVLYNNLLTFANQYAGQLPGLQQKLMELNIDSASILKNSLGQLGNWTLGTVSLVGTVFGQIMNFVLAAIFSLYLLASKEDLKNKCDGLLNTFMKPERKYKLYEVLGTANESFSSYTVGQFKEAIIIGLLCTFGMMLFRFPHATVIGPVIGLTALIPMIGAYIGAGIGFLLIVINDPIQALLFIVFIIVLQQIEGNVIYPKVVGESIGLPGIWVFTAIIIGGGLLGIAGIFLGVPVAATIYKLTVKAIHERRLRMNACEGDNRDGA